MRRARATWLLFAAGVIVALAGLGWVTAAALDLDRREAASRARAEREESVRLALWRMDSAVSPLVAAESARPYFLYSAFYPAQGAYTAMFRNIAPGRVRIASPLLTHRDPLVKIHFQIAEEGPVCSPQVPVSNMLDLAESAYLGPGVVEERGRVLATLADVLREATLRERLPAPPAGVMPVPFRTVDVADGRASPAQGRGGQEWRARQDFAHNAQMAQTELANPAVRVGSLNAIRVGAEILLARRVRIADREYVQGLWLDGSALTAWLLDQVHDLLPEASLSPVPDASGGDDTRRLATLPLRLEPGEVPARSEGGTSPVTIAIVIAWGCVLLGGVGAAALLRSALVLGDRRAAFVSAVTHELRTPLTTFRMYTELLASKMVDGERRDRYLDTLQREADRLGHLVENVLAYAGLERGKARNGLQALPVDEVLERLRPGLTESAERSGLRLEIEVAEDVGSVRADRSALERILHNLVDNAAKYAAGAEDRRVRIEAVRRGDRVVVAVVDGGPGVEASEASRIFRPFRKSASEAANSAPGVGLGLALARSLARAMGGDLRLADGPAPGGLAPGARFELTLSATSTAGTVNPSGGSSSGGGP